MARSADRGLREVGLKTQSLGRAAVGERTLEAAERPSPSPLRRALSLVGLLSSTHALDEERIQMVTSATCVPAREVTAELADLNLRKRALSRRRGTDAQRIDRFSLPAPIDDADIALLYRLEGAERELSAQRRRLHREIDQLRARIGLQPWPEYHDSAA